MTQYEFEKSLSKEQLTFYRGVIKEAYNLEEKYYRENVALKQEIMLMLQALNFEPIQSVPALAEMMRGTRERFLKAKEMTKKQRDEQRNEMKLQIEAFSIHLESLSKELHQIKDKLENMNRGGGEEG